MRKKIVELIARILRVHIGFSPIEKQVFEVRSSKTMLIKSIIEDKEGLPGEYIDRFIIQDLTEKLKDSGLITVYSKETPCQYGGRKFIYEAELEILLRP